MNSAVISSKLKVANAMKACRKYSVAAALYQEVIDQYPDDFRAYFNLAQLKSSLGLELVEAVDLFLKVIELDPSIIDTYGTLGGLYIKLHQPESAVEYCRKGLALVPNDSSCLFNLNVALRQCGRMDEAIHETWSAIGIDRSKYQLNDADLSSSSRNKNNRSSRPMTVVCIKWGAKYSAQYVNNLYLAVLKHYGAHHELFPLKFICFTDDTTGIDERVQCVPFDSDISGFRAWWLKVQIFSPKHCSCVDDSVSPLLEGLILYLDLDTVICDSLTFLDVVAAKHCESESAHLGSIYVLNAEEFQNEGIVSPLIYIFA